MDNTPTKRPLHHLRQVFLYLLDWVGHVAWRVWHHHARLLTALVLMTLLAFAGVLLFLRYAVLPGIDQYRPALEQSLSQRLGQPVTIGKLQGDWSGLHPRVSLLGLRVGRAGQPASLTLDSIQAVLSWWSLPTLSARFDSIVVSQPELNLRLDAAGKLWLGSLWLNQPGPDTGVTDWVLQQHLIQVLNARIGWQDEQHKLQPLQLDQVNVRMSNHGSRHRFGLVGNMAGVTPQLDLRGDLRGDSLQELEDWRGKLYARLEHVQVAPLAARLPFALPVRDGNGAMQAWLQLKNGKLVAVDADVLLHAAKGQLGNAMPFDLAELQGRAGWSSDAGSSRIYSRQLALVMRNGVRLNPTDFDLKLTQGEGGAVEAGELSANRLDAQELLQLLPYVPQPDDLREQLKQLAPSGRVEQLAASWQGIWPQLQQYSLKARFEHAGVAAMGKIPGVRNVSGSLEATEKGGNLSLDSRASTLSLPLVFRQPLSFNNLRASVSWEKSQNDTLIKLGQITFDNAALSGKVVGSYLSQPDSAGEIDLTGNLFRADARYVYQYLPLIINRDALKWLDHAFLAGSAKDVFVRLKGPLQRFPFADGKSGQFIVKAPIEGGRLHYGEGWPEFDNLHANLLFSGARMQVDVEQGRVMGARLAPVSVVIPDLMSSEEQLLVHGEANGTAQQLLTFVEKSPVHDMTRGFTRGLQGSGMARVLLDLDMPLRHVVDTKVRGAVHFTDNQLRFASAIPTLDKVTGELTFDEHGLYAKSIRAMVVGGPATVDIDTVDSSVKVSAQGRATGPGLQGYLTFLPAAVLRGETGWKGEFDIQNSSSIQLESDLRGLVVTLPAPYAKSAAGSLPLHLNMIGQANGTELWAGGLGKWAAFKLRRPVGAPAQGIIQLGEREPRIERDGIWLQGELPVFDLDAWRRLAWPDSGSSANGLALSGVNLKFQQLDAGSRRFAALQVDAHHTQGEWQASLNGRDMQGEVNWNGDKGGKLIGRFKRFVVPAAVPKAVTATATDTNAATSGSNDNLPVLDLVAERFDIGSKQLGRLEVLAQPAGNSWNLSRLNLTAPDYVLNMQGVWDQSQLPGRTSSQLQLEVKDIGAFLGRLGFEGTVKRGKATLQGQLSWQDEPAELDYPSLSGQLRLEAEKGQFLKIDPGAGKLLGILSLQALPRRITLDFRDVFSEGFAFDSIEGDMRISKGVLATDNFRIEGPAARIEMKGTTDLDKETQDLHLHVQPTLTDSVSVAGALLGGPAVGVASYVLQKVLRNPVEQMVSYDYKVSGTWTDPVVAKVSQPAARSGGSFEGN